MSTTWIRLGQWQATVCSYLRTIIIVIIYTYIIYVYIIYVYICIYYIYIYMYILYMYIYVYYIYIYVYIILYILYMLLSRIIRSISHWLWIGRRRSLRPRRERRVVMLAVTRTASLSTMMKTSSMRCAHMDLMVIHGHHCSSTGVATLMYHCWCSYMV